MVIFLGADHPRDVSSRESRKILVLIAWEGPVFFLEVEQYG
jgi:hypothetical protein